MDRTNREPNYPSASLECSPANPTPETLSSAIIAWTDEHAPQGIFTTDCDLRLTSWNQWLEHHSRLRAEQVLGKPLVEVIPSLLERRLHHYYRDALLGESKLLSRSLHGFLLPLPPTVIGGPFAHMQQSARIGPLVLAGGICGTITIIEDVTEREWQHGVLRQARQRSELLARTLARLISIRDADELVREIYIQMSLPLRLDYCMHYVLEPDSQRLELHSAGVSDNKHEQCALLELGQALCATVLHTRERVLLNHIQQQQGASTEAFRKFGLTAFAGFPLLMDNRLLGTLCFGARSRDAFTNEDVQLLFTISQYAAIALDRARQEHQLRLSEERFRYMADTVPGFIFTAGPDGSLDYLNSRFYEITGMQPGSGLGYGWMQALEPAEMERVNRRWQQCLATGQSYNMECRIRDRHGKLRWYYAVARPITDQKNRISKWFGAAADIQELQQTHEELTQAQQKLADHAASLERQVEQRTVQLRETIRHLESFSYTVAHDLRAPIRHIESYASMLLEDYGGQLDEKARQFLTNMGRAAHRLDALTQDVLNYTRVATEKTVLRSVDPEQVLQDVLVMNPELQSPNVEVTILRPLPPVLADETLLSQCFSNYLSNAAKFMKPGGIPRIVIGADPAPGLVLHPAAPTGESRSQGGTHAHEARRETPRGAPRLRLWVQDNGIGIAPDAQRKIFGIFQRARGVGNIPGTGIGLAIVTKAVERMHGVCGVESAPGEGSRFWIELEAA